MTRTKQAAMAEFKLALEPTRTGEVESGEGSGRWVRAGYFRFREMRLRRGR
jgi:hypothetical protein